MATWLSKVKSALTGEAEMALQVRRELEAMQRSRAKLHIEIATAGGAAREALASSVEQVRDDDVIISQPSSGATTRPLAAGERVLLQFTAGGGVVVGAARVLGRIKLPSGGKRMFFGYHVTIPDRFQIIERRQHERITLDEETAPQVHLMRATPTAEPRTPFSATLVDISVGGAQVRIDADAPMVLHEAKLLLVADFPMPVGSIVHPVTVMRVTQDANSGATRLGLQFDAPVPNLDQFLEVLKTRQARRST